MDVWDRCFGKYTVNRRIREDKVKDVIWCNGNLDANKEERYVVLICGTNIIDKNVPADVGKGIEHTIQLIKCKFYNCKVVVLEILLRNSALAYGEIKSN